MHEAVPWFTGRTISDKLTRGYTDAQELADVLQYSIGLADAARRCVDAMKFITEAATLARVTGQPLKSVWTRGKMLQAVNMLLRAAKSRGFLVPDFGTPRDATAQEAPLTLDPEGSAYTRSLTLLTLLTKIWFPEVSLTGRLWR